MSLTDNPKVLTHTIRALQALELRCLVDVWKMNLKTLPGSSALQRRVEELMRTVTTWPPEPP